MFVLLLEMALVLLNSNVGVSSSTKFALVMLYSNVYDSPSVCPTHKYALVQHYSNVGVNPRRLS